MTDLYYRPDAVDELLDFATEVVIDEVRLYASLGVHGLTICDPSASGSVVSPKHFARFAMPSTKRVSEVVTELGLEANPPRLRRHHQDTPVREGDRA